MAVLRSVRSRLPVPVAVPPSTRHARPVAAPTPLLRRPRGDGLAEVLADVLGAEQVSVDAHFFDDLGADSMVMARFCARVRKRADLPSVSIRTSTGTRRSALAWRLAPAHAAARHGERPSRRPSPRCWPTFWVSSRCRSTSHFFDDLGADSMVMARFCARVRKRPDLPSVSMKDVYRHPTISEPGGGVRAGAAAPPGRRAGRRRRHPGEPRRSPAVRPRRRHAGRHAAVRPVRGAAVPVLPRLLLARRRWSPCAGFEWISAGSSWSTSTCGRWLFGAGDLRRAVPAADRGEVGAGRSVEAAADPHLEPGLPPVLGGQDPRPVEPAGRCSSGRRSTCSTCGRWARRSGGASRSSPGTCPSARTCSRSATARSSARTRSSAATGPTTV